MSKEMTDERSEKMSPEDALEILADMLTEVMMYGVVVIESENQVDALNVAIAALGEKTGG